MTASPTATLPSCDDTEADTLSLAATAARIGAQVAGPAAADVDQKSRFPVETIEALRSERLLGALIPIADGGLGATLTEVAEMVTELGRHCSSAGMVFAMHQIQVACLVRHGRNPVLRAFLRRVADEQLLLASATTEVGIGGDVRRSTCAVEISDGSFSLTKQAPVISYGAYADAILATARRTPDSPPNDQVLAVCQASNLSLEEKSGWDALGFRGTCSLGYLLTATGDADLILDDAYGDISGQTMLPVSHILWSSLWLGMSQAAFDKARTFVQAAARKTPGVMPPNAIRLAELATVVQQIEGLVDNARRLYAEVADDPDRTGSIGFAVAMNSLKVSASTLVVDIVGRALLICGMAGYANASPFSLGRLLRDAYGSQLMVNNDRINGNNAQLLLVQRGR